MQHSAPQPSLQFNGFIPTPKMPNNTPFGPGEETTGKPEPEEQVSGIIVVIAFLLFYVYELYCTIMKLFFRRRFTVQICFEIITYISKFVFFCAILAPTYASGKPGLIKFLPFILGSLLYFLYIAFTYPLEGVIVGTIIDLIYCAVVYSLFMGDDDSGSCFLFAKPWIYKPIKTHFYGYPAQFQGYAPQGYPPRAPDYSVYPPQPQQGYGFSPQPQQGYPPRVPVYFPQAQAGSAPQAQAGSVPQAQEDSAAQAQAGFAPEA